MFAIFGGRSPKPEAPPPSDRRYTIEDVLDLVEVSMRNSERRMAERVLLYLQGGLYLIAYNEACEAL